MLKKLSVSKFRGFHALTIAVPKVLILMGPNSSGKTTALHAIRIACQAVWLAVENESKHSLNGHSIEFKDFVIRDIAQLMPVADWQALFVDQVVGESTHFTITFEFEDHDPISQIKIDGKYARNENLKISATVTTPSLATEIHSLSAKTSEYKNKIADFLKRHLPKAILIPPFYGVIRDEEYRAKAVVDSMVGSADQSHVVRNMISRLTSLQFTQLNAFLKDMIGAELVQRTQGDAVEQVKNLRVTFRDTNGELELSAAGAGLINLVAIYSSLARWQAESAERQIIFLLDEPEAHLHPNLQSFTANRLATVITSEFNAQLMMATHSVDIINKVGEREDAAVFRTDRLDKVNGGQELIGQSALLDDISQWADMTPFSMINFFASKRVFFYEGQSDGDILKKCADILYRNNPKKKKSFEKWTFVKLDGSGNEKVATMLARLIASNLVPANLNLQQFKILVQLDKDYSDQRAVYELVPDVAITTYRNVWTRHSIESLFCEPDTLLQWLQPNYASLQLSDIESAIESVNQNSELKQYAKEQRQSFLLKTLEKTDTNITATHRQASQDVDSTPEVWQRGKNRASSVLGLIKNSLGGHANNMTTSLPKIIERADSNSFPAGNLATIPAEIRGLLEWMVDNG